MIDKIKINDKIYSLHRVTLSNKEIKKLRKGETIVFINRDLKDAIAVDFVKDNEVTN